VLLTLGRLYKLTGYREQAVASFREAIKLLPFAAEVVEELVDAGGGEASLASDHGPSSSGSNGLSDLSGCFGRVLQCRKESVSGVHALIQPRA
jgi:hypothetical protein